MRLFTTGVMRQRLLILRNRHHIRQVHEHTSKPLKKHYRSVWHKVVWRAPTWGDCIYDTTWNPGVPNWRDKGLHVTSRPQLLAYKIHFWTHDRQHIPFALFYSLLGKKLSWNLSTPAQKIQLGMAARHHDEGNCTRCNDSRQHSFGGRSLYSEAECHSWGE